MSAPVSTSSLFDWKLNDRLITTDDIIQPWGNKYGMISKNTECVVIHTKKTGTFGWLTFKALDEKPETFTLRFDLWDNLNKRF